MYAVEKEIRELRKTEWGELTLDEQAGRGSLRFAIAKRHRCSHRFANGLTRQHGDVLPKSDLGHRTEFRRVVVHHMARADSSAVLWSNSSAK
jgi:hypothetical protein